VRGLEALLFWLMLLTGAAVLAPCLVLPAWLEYQAQLERRQAAVAYLAALEFRLDAAQKQIEHLHNDPAYVMRLAEQEFGRALDAADSETIYVAPSPEDDTPLPPMPPRYDPNSAGDVVPELSAFLEQVVQRYPHACVFAVGRTRPFLMAIGGILIVTAVLLLGRPGGHR
jgi:type II secretory pathway pseudopilin PulG